MVLADPAIREWQRNEHLERNNQTPVLVRVQKRHPEEQQAPVLPVIQVPAPVIRAAEATQAGKFIPAQVTVQINPE